MKLILQILFLYLSWFTSLANATPVFTKVVLPSNEISFSKIENVKEESIVKIGIQNFARSGILESPFPKNKISEEHNVLESPVRAGNRKVLQGAGKVLVKSWNEAIKAVDDLIKPQINKLKNLYPDAKMGYRGSLSTGTKYSTGGPFDPTDWDVDAFIVSDNLAAKFPNYA